MEKRRIVQTADGSPTLQLPELKEQYHSMHGAMQEAYHVFIDHGLACLPPGAIRILEMGFGTGLNALITLLEAREPQRQITYTGLEAYPIKPQEWEALNYGNQFDPPEAVSFYTRLHEAPWDTIQEITPWFHLCKRRMDIREFDEEGRYDLVYYDAFGARVQPELWTEAIFSKMYAALVPGGILVTYAAKGSVRRSMIAAGFAVERLPGPPGKREMLRATRPQPSKC